MRQKMWEDLAATDPTKRFSEARGGHKQEWVTNKKQTERVRRRKWKWRCMISSTLQTQENKHITKINKEKEIEEDDNSDQVALQNWLLGGREKRSRKISEIECSAMPCALHCYLIYSFSSSYNHTFALTFYVSSFAIKKMILHVCTCVLVDRGLSNNNLTWQNMLACSYYFLIRVWQPKSSSIWCKHLQYASCLRCY